MGFGLAQVWTYKGRVAFVLSVTENGRPIQDANRLEQLKKILTRMVNTDGHGVVHAKLVSVFMCAEALKSGVCG